MKMPDNTIGSVRDYFSKQLFQLYDQREIDQLFFIAAEYYLGLQKYELRLQTKNRLSESQLLQFIYCVKDLKQFKPIQYILGTAPFYGLDFKVNDQVLIPRPETEELVDWIVQEYPTGESLTIMDIGTGSGCIAIALKKSFPKAKVCAMDVSTSALTIARENADLNRVAIDWIQGDILKLPLLEEKFDIIVSNPPYIGKEEAVLMRENVLDFEPHLALFVEDDDKLLFYKKIADWAREHLNPSGKIFYELNESNGNELKAWLAEKHWDALIRNDINDKERMMKVSR